MALCYLLLEIEGRGLEARPATGHLLGRVEPLAQPATAREPGGCRMWRITMLVATLLVGVFLASGVALATTEFGGPSNDALIGTNAADRLYGRAGDDAILGLGGNDPRLVGGSGDDSASGGRGDDRILGPGVVSGGEPTYEKGSDTLSGDAGDDQVIGGLGPDTL